MPVVSTRPASRQLNEHRKADGGDTVKVRDARVLIVDDDAESRLAVKCSLEEQGFRCDLAADGNEALYLIGNQYYDVIVTELLLPRTNGGELIIKLCTLENAPVVTVHTCVFERDVYLGLKSEGVEAVFFKPHNFGVMADTIKTLVRRRSASKTAGSQIPWISKLKECDAWIQGSRVRVEVFRFTIMLLATILLSLGVGSAIEPGVARTCKMFGLCGLAFYFCLEFVAYHRAQQRTSLMRCSAERRLAKQIWSQKEFT